MKNVELSKIQLLEDIGKISLSTNPRNVLSVILENGMESFQKKYWTDYGIEKLLELENRNDGSMMNATKFLKNIGEI